MKRGKQLNTQKTNLSPFFPMIRAKELILDEITSDASLSDIYENWRSDQQEYFLDILTGTRGNVEVQKLGYAFTGERASCYSADLLLRQYKRVRAH